MPTSGGKVKCKLCGSVCAAGEATRCEGLGWVHKDCLVGLRMAATAAAQLGVAQRPQFGNEKKRTV